MSLRRTLLLAALISMAPTALVVAQTDPQSNTTPPAASTPHEQQATKDRTHMASKQSMKECIAKQQADHSGMSKADARKACKAQMKGSG